MVQSPPETMIGIPSGCDTGELPPDAEFAQDLDYDLDFGEDNRFTWMQEQLEDTNATWTTAGQFPATTSSENDGIQALDTTVPAAEPSTGTTTIGQSQTPAASVPPKSGHRFSTRVAKMLRNWFAAHQRDPYATAEDIEMLQGQTGLSQQQITNWLANARRRSKPINSRIQASCIRDDTHSTSTGANSVNIPGRPPTPMPCEDMSPLQRWQHSPPECEPATIASISRAVAASAASGFSSPRPTGSSDNVSTISSTGNSHSSRASGSHISSYSYSSGDSLRILTRQVSRRRRRRMPKRQGYPRPSLLQTYHTYQCTFCPETFETKHNWTRHENSMHLSLERWICSLNGSTARDPMHGMSCVYCGQADPNEAHLKAHNYDSCVEGPIEKRTFYRKDHLNQHLKLVHGASYMKGLMDSWKTGNAQIKSRCGFCDIPLTSWAARVHHLAEHFRSGSTMANWTGGWGFDSHVNEIVENAIPPCEYYFQHYESFN